MCNPALIFAGVAVAGALVGGAAQYRQLDAAQDQAKYDATLKKYQARDAAQRGQREEELVRARVAKIRAMQRAAFAASGVVTDYGSSLDVLEDTTYYGELDALTTRANFEREAWGYRAEARSAENRADSLRTQKYFSIGTTLLGAASAAMGAYSKATGGLAAYQNTNPGAASLVAGPSVQSRIPSYLGYSGGGP